MGKDARGGRPLNEQEQEQVARARAQAIVFYKGESIGHHSCGISVAKTLGVPHKPYQALRRGGINGTRFCGSILAGELVLGELLGDEDPTGPVTESLREAVTWYQDLIPSRIDKGSSPDYVCNHLTAPLGAFLGPERKDYCTQLTGEVAALVTEALLRFGDGE